MRNHFRTLRLILTKFAKALLSPLNFRGKGTLLTTLCPHDGETPISLFGYHFDCDLSDHIQRTIFLFGYDEDAEQFIRTHLKPGDTFVDVGANVGFYSLLAASIVGNAGRVVAVEPNPRALRKLRQTIARNGLTNVRVEDVALGRTRGTLNLSFLAGADNDTPTLVAGDGGESVPVRVVTLNELADDTGLGRVHYLKMDVEGYEPDVLAGASALLAEGRIHALQSEFNDYWLRQNGCSPEGLHHILTDASFTDIGGAPTFTSGCIVDRFFVKQPAGN